jgi:protein SCO1/2
LIRALIITLTLCGIASAPARADTDWQNAATLTPQLGTTVPADLTFSDETGATVQLKDYLGSSPVLLLPVYYRCPNLCGTLLRGVFAALTQLPPGDGNYKVVAFSIDPRETPAIAAQERVNYAREFPGVIGANTHLLTSREVSSAALARTLGFRYAFDPASGQYAHDAEIVVLTADGTIAAYLPSLVPSAAELQNALDEARKGVIARGVDRLVLFCFHLLPAAGRNTPLIEHVLQAAAVTSTLALGGLIWLLRRRSRGSRA